MNPVAHGVALVVAIALASLLGSLPSAIAESSPELWVSAFATSVGGGLVEGAALAFLGHRAPRLSRTRLVVEGGLLAVLVIAFVLGVAVGATSDASPLGRLLPSYSRTSGDRALRTFAQLVVSPGALLLLVGEWGGLVFAASARASRLEGFALALPECLAGVVVDGIARALGPARVVGWLAYLFALGLLVPGMGMLAPSLLRRIGIDLAPAED